ncbi:MAG TPA: NAD-binding protein [Stellaceae bacterium]|jgi:putative dehydrogenase|nr:NAD-binding protein [Stellaceae bacterium]
MKLINNMLGQIATVAIAEALVFGKKAGLDLQKIYEVVRVSTGSSVQFENRGAELPSGLFQRTTSQ